MSRSSKNNVIITAESLMVPYASQPQLQPQQQPQTQPQPRQQILETKEQQAPQQPQVNSTPAEEPQVQLSIKKLPFDTSKISSTPDINYVYVQEHEYICINIDGRPYEKIIVKPFNGNLGRIVKYANSKCQSVKSDLLSKQK
jgi:hypothetical protein